MLAAAIFLFRARAVMAAKTAQEITEVFRELCHIKCIPLLQYFLFPPE